MPRSAGSPELPQVTCSLAVFAPSPVVTITIESSPGDGPDIHLHAGGQGFWVARMAARLGARVSLCVPLGGETGTVLESLLAVDGISALSVQTENSNGAYVHDRRRGEREVIAETPSPSLARHELDDLYGITLAAGLDSDAVLVTGPRNEGVLHADLFERLCRDLRTNGRLVLADLSGEPLTAALRGGVDFLKVSDQELLDDQRLGDRGLPAALETAGGLPAEGAANVLVTRSAESAVLHAGGRVFAVRSPRFAPVDEHGAGDSLFAGIGVAIGAGLPIEAAVKLGVAAGALNVARHGLGTGHMREVARLAEEVRVDPLPLDQLEAGGGASAAATAS